MQPTFERADTIVAGGGVSGLATACVLQAAGMAVTVLEADDVVGGRVRSARAADGTLLGDLGPSWVWPPHQPALAAWLTVLGVGTVEQFETGPGCIERAIGQPVQQVRLPSQHGQHRPRGGPQAIVDALRARLPAAAVRTGTRVTAIGERADGLHVTTDLGDSFTAAHVVLAAPLRVIARDIAFDPPLPDALGALLADSPTWMASQAKALIVYDRPFWRERGLSGRIASTIGPLVEAHDHSGEDGRPAALVGFVGVGATDRATLARERGPDALAQSVIEQLVRCFGTDAATPAFVRIEDWAQAPFIATDADVARPGGHPSVLPPVVRAAGYAGRLHFGVAETATTSPGLLEGALTAGERAARAVLGSAQLTAANVRSSASSRRSTS